MAGGFITFEHTRVSSGVLHSEGSFATGQTSILGCVVLIHVQVRLVPLRHSKTELLETDGQVNFEMANIGDYSIELIQV